MRILTVPPTHPSFHAPATRFRRQKCVSKPAPSAVDCHAPSLSKATRHRAKSVSFCSLCRIFVNFRGVVWPLLTLQTGHSARPAAPEPAERPQTGIFFRACGTSWRQPQITSGAWGGWLRTRPERPRRQAPFETRALQPVGYTLHPPERKRAARAGCLAGNPSDKRGPSRSAPPNQWAVQPPSTTTVLPVT